MAELVDALDSGSSRGNSVDVRVILAAIKPTIAFVAGGSLQPSALLAAQLNTYPKVVAVDLGLAYCDQMGIRPDLLVGDFDSVPPHLLLRYKGLPTISCATDKDKTDLEIALEQPFESAVVFGALGGRTDHLLGNITLLSRYPGRLFFVSDRELLFVIHKKTTLHTHPGQTLSLVPLNGPVTGIITHGLKWPLRHAALDKQFLGISNLCLGNSVSISVENGDLLCCLQLHYNQ